MSRLQSSKKLVYRARLFYHLSFFLDNIIFLLGIVRNCLVTGLLRLVKLVGLTISLVFSRYSTLKSIQSLIKLVDGDS